MVITVENWSVDDINCQDPDSGMMAQTMDLVGKEVRDLGSTIPASRVLCEETVRFTHAYSPSTFALPSFLSLLTGLYPQNHGVWMPSGQALNESLVTLPERLLKSGYATALFSSGPPIGRNSGVQQGFEHIVELVPLDDSDREDSFFQLVDSHFNWASRNTDRPFASFFYFNDLLARDAASARSSNLNLFHRKLGFLFEKLKSKGEWPKTYLLVAGLNGAGSSVSPTSEVKFENTAVAAFIKPNSRNRDDQSAFKIDHDVSLVDLGATLLEEFGQQKSQIQAQIFDSQSLKSLVDNKPVESSRWNNRPVWVETPWSAWNGLGGSLFGVRQAGWFFEYREPKTLVYQSAIDRFESSPLSFYDLELEAKRSEIERVFQIYGIPRYRSDPWGERAKKAIWLLRLNQSDTMKQALGLLFQDFEGLTPSQKKSSRSIFFLYLKKAIDEELDAQVAVMHSVFPVAETYEYLLARGGHERIQKTKRDPCLKSFAEQAFQSFYKDCQSETARLLFRYLSKVGKSDSQAVLFQLARLAREVDIQNQISEKNIELEGYWYPILDSGPRGLDLSVILSLPRYQKLRTRLKKEVSLIK